MAYDLNVPYEEKDLAKSLGARWDPRRRTWYCETLTKDLRYWYEGDEDEDEDPAGGHIAPMYGAPMQGTSAYGDTVPRTPVNGTPVHGTSVHGNPVHVALSSGSSLRKQGADGSGSLETDAFPDYRSVTEIKNMISGKFATLDCFVNILVKGEITNYSGPNDYGYYFGIKDSQSLISCVIWNSHRHMLGFDIEVGKQVAINGKLTFSTKGIARIEVRQIFDIGAGKANLAYLQLKARLEAEGLFSEDHKKAIPAFPGRVGIVTSKDGQARKDIEKIARKRNPYVELILYHVNVQGQNAVRSIIDGIAQLDKMNLDTIIVGRGGGSLEELMAYNDEGIARLVYDASTPIISAVGHEGNWSLIDYVSDKRVATPTEAAEEAIPDVMSTVRRIGQLERNMADNAQNAVRLRFLRLQTQEARLAGNDPVKALNDRKVRLGHLQENLDRNIRTVFERKKNRFGMLLERLNGLSPTAKLVQGFGYIQMDGRPVQSVSDVKTGDVIDIRIHDGHIEARVTETKGNEKENER